MSRVVWRSHVGIILMSLALYWTVCLAVLFLGYPMAWGDKGVLGAPLTFLVIGAWVTPMDVRDGFPVSLPEILAYLVGVMCLLLAVVFRRWGWAAFPGLGCIGGLGASIFVGAGS